MDPILIAVITGVLGLACAGFMAAYVLRREQGTERIREISGAIKEGALAFLGREYRILVIFVVAVTIILGVIPTLGLWVALSFVFGAICSGLAGFIGMNMAIRSNSRTAAAAQKSLNEGLRVSFRGGSVMGMCVVGIGILGLSILYFIFHNNPDFLKIIPGFGFGASSVAIFARVGGGIYTKAADTGADLVGKVEKGIPEDDPRNAAVVADFVGDNVGDVAGMGADQASCDADAQSYGSYVSYMTLTPGHGGSLTGYTHDTQIVSGFIESQFQGTIVGNRFIVEGSPITEPGTACYGGIIRYVGTIVGGQMTGSKVCAGDAEGACCCYAGTFLATRE